MKVYNKILVIPDIHFPFADWKAIKEMISFKNDFKPDLVVCLGDLLDQKAWSRWPKDPDDFSPEIEWIKSEEDVKRLHSYIPKMEIILGNHDMRTMSKAFEVNMPSSLIRQLHQVFDFKHWNWHKLGNVLKVNTKKGNTVFIHGDEMGGTPIQKAKILGLNVVQGHTHKASLVYHCDFEKQIYAMDCGCLADLKSKAMRYHVRSPLQYFKGFAYIEKGVPNIVPL